MRHSYEVAGVEITRYKAGYKLQEYDTNPWYDDNRDWIYPLDFDALVSQTDNDFIVEKTYYEISITPIGEGVGIRNSGIAFLQDGSGASDFEYLFEKLVAEFEPIFKQYGEKAQIDEIENVGPNDLTMLSTCDRVTFIGLFNIWDIPGDGWETESDNGVDFVCRVNPDKLKLLKE